MDFVLPALYDKFLSEMGEDFDQGVNDDESRRYNEMFKVHKFEK